MTALNLNNGKLTCFDKEWQTRADTQFVVRKNCLDELQKVLLSVENYYAIKYEKWLRILYKNSKLAVPRLIPPTFKFQIRQEIKRIIDLRYYQK